ncbi:hypothetical protein HNP55_004471 [Paucibacter oligotrophus]|uniref:Uncharacterized protein n=1 Tax=Roseateles oligotrophus TaxID=1769250 RepID=A0A840LKU5_9BURK|nr:hypothetical protein [Roseateles oligotrophus]MBB4845917.1 hypothetical protein [Roseateles oligotrophus]
MAAELDAVSSPGAACSFALGCLGLALKLRLFAMFWVAVDPLTQGTTLLFSSLAGLGGACACLAVLAGGVFMALAGAPPAWPWMNGVSLSFALLSLALLPRQRLQTDVRLRATLCFLLGAVLLACTALEPIAGLAGRWLRLGPVTVQPVWLLLPSLLLLSGRAPNTGAERFAGSTGLGLALAIVALIAQAELCWLLLMGLILLLRGGRRPGHRGESLLACLALLGAGMTSQTWQAPSTQAFVDQVLMQSWSQGSGLALAWLLPAALLPSVLPVWRHRHALEHGLLWSGIFLLSLPGWLPSPLLGMGGSAILGYVLSLAAVPGPGQRLVGRSGAATPPNRREPSGLLRLY